MFCHPRAGGGPEIQLDPRFHGDDILPINLERIGYVKFIIYLTKSKNPTQKTWTLYKAAT